MPTRSQISVKMQHVALTVLARHAAGLPVGVLWRTVRQEYPEVDADWAAAGTGKTLAEKNFRWTSSQVVKAGSMTKRDGVWSITGIGRRLLAEYTDGAQWWAVHHRRYEYWRANQASFKHLDDQLNEAVPEGTWISIDDLAELHDLVAVQVVRYLRGVQPAGWFRALDNGGRFPPEAHLTEEERAEWMRALEKDGVNLSGGPASGLQRLGLDELRLQVETTADGAPGEAARRVWLVRGQSRNLRWLVRDRWLVTGVVTLAHDLLTDLPAGASREQVRQAVELEYDGYSPDRRNRIINEQHAFLSRLAEGDLVLTSEGGDFYLGEITGNVISSRTPEGETVLQRTVRWWNPFRPVAYEELPDELATLLGDANARVVELSSFAGDLVSLVPEASSGLSAPAAPAFAADDLREITEEFAEELCLPQAWLQECVESLRDRPQLILYGPPGTGKTHVARELASYLADGRRENVQLVQFHPSYTYEDFFQGFRPVTRDDSGAIAGQMRFELAKGPLYRLAEAAEELRGQPFFLVIDEINRGDIARIFGELYFLLEYRGESITLQYSAGSKDGEVVRRFELPPNLFIIGTMNSADRSIALFDQALRRRFTFTGLRPGEEPVASMLRRWLDAHGWSDESARLLDELNRRIDDPEARVGPSYLMNKRVQAPGGAGLARVWTNQILPLLTEHHYGEGIDIEATYGLAALRQAIGSAGPAV